MTHLIRAELLKLRTIRRSGPTCRLARLRSGQHRPGDLRRKRRASTPVEGFRNVMAAASSGGVMLLLIGILVMAGEFRHVTATATFLITPERRRVVAAKIAAAAIVGACVGVVASLLTVAVALPWLSRKESTSARTRATSASFSSEASPRQRCRRSAGSASAHSFPTRPSPSRARWSGCLRSKASSSPSCPVSAAGSPVARPRR